MSCDVKSNSVRLIGPTSFAVSDPFLLEEPNCRFEKLDQAYSFAFNYADPNGILLFPTCEINEVRENFTLQGVGSRVVRENDEGRQKVTSAFFRPSQRSNPPSQDYWVHLTDSCNLGCFYCYIPEIEKFRHNSDHAMSSEVASLILKRALSDAKMRGVYRLHFKFAGGEPSLAVKEIESFCSLCDQFFDPETYKITFGIITNGVLMPDELLKIAVERNFNVSFSIDGVEKYHDRTRHLGPSQSNSGSWTTIIENAKRLSLAGIKPFFLHTLTASNLEGLSELQQFLAKNSWNFRVSLVRLHQSPSKAQKHKFVDNLERVFYLAASTLPLQTRFDQHLQFAEWNIRRKKTLACGSGRNYLAVDASGAISSCQMASVPAGQLEVSTIADARTAIRDNEGTSILADPTLRTGGCSKCFFRYTCAGGCPQHTARVNGTMNSVSPWCDVYGDLYPKYIRAAALHQYRRLQHLVSNA
jgi:uncharacterized protein